MLNMQNSTKSLKYWVMPECGDVIYKCVQEMVVGEARPRDLQC